MPDEPIIVTDNYEPWVVYPGDPPYKLVADMPRDEEGVVHVDPSFLAKVKGWWHDKAAAKVTEHIAALAVPWEDFQITDGDINGSSTDSLSSKLAKIGYYMSLVCREQAMLEAKLSLAKSALDQVVGRLLAQQVGDKGALGPRSALIISQDKRLRNTKIEIMEADGYKHALDKIFDALDINWKTASRVLSARLKEPLE